tara:strand:- start:427 stop:3711 length:3285 start_codon:yes stop_codon:yes gene_type:complete
MCNNIEPGELKYKGFDWLYKNSVEKTFIKLKKKQLLLKYNEVKKKIKDDKIFNKEFNIFKKNNHSISPLLEIYNNEKEKIRVKINIDKNKYPYTLFTLMTIDELSEYIEKNNSDTYEVLHNDNYRKAYFDFDIKVEKKILNIIECEYYKNIILQINKIFKDAKLSISGSCGYKEKINGFQLSLHVIVNNYCFRDLEHQKLNNIKKLASILEADVKVYNSNQSFKLPLQSKKEDKKNKDRIQKIIIDNELSNHIIQCVDDECKEIKDEITIFYKENNVLFNVGDTTINKYNKRINNGTNFNIYERITEKNNISLHRLHDNLYDIVKHIPIENIKYSEYYFIIGCFVLENIDFKRMWKAIGHRKYKNKTHDKKYWKNIYNTQLLYYKRIEEKSIKFIVKNKRFKLFDLIEQFYGKIENKYVFNFKKDEIKDNELFDKIIKNKFLNLEDLPKDEKNILLKINMGGGKTNNINLLLRIHPKKSVISLTNRISLAQNQLQEFNKKCDDVEIKRINKYLKIETNSPDVLYGGNKFKMYKHARYTDKRVVCEIESIGKNNIRKKYDYVIIDEIESLFLSFGSTKCMEKVGYGNNWSSFIKLILNAEKVICMDAYLSKRTLDFFKNIGLNYYLIGKENDKIDKKINLYNDFDLYLEQLKKDLLLKKRICFMYPYKTGKVSQFKLHIEDIKQLMSQYGNIKEDQIKVYHGDTKCKDKKELNNVNKAWDKNKNGDLIQVVIYNGTISVGVNCNIIYDKLYITYADHTYPRTTIQGTLRFRKFTDNIVEMYVFKNPLMYLDLFDEPCFNKPYIDEEDIKKYLHDYNEEEIINIFCNTHKQLMRGIDRENKSKNFETLKYFFDITGYEIINYITSDENKKLSIAEINKKWTPDKIYIPDIYDDVAEIDDHTSKQYLRLQNMGQFYRCNDNDVNPFITQSQTLELKKYFLDKMFISSENMAKFYKNNDMGEENINNIIYDYENYLISRKQLLFKKEYILNGIKDVIQKKGCINFVLNKNFEINNKKITKKQKEKINKNYNLGEINKLTDNVIKKRILKSHFMKDITETMNDSKKIKINEDIQDIYFNCITCYHVKYWKNKQLKKIIT